jgi:hypothetical protein
MEVHWFDVCTLLECCRNRRNADIIHFSVIDVEASTTQLDIIHFSVIDVEASTTQLA